MVFVVNTMLHFVLKYWKKMFGITQLPLWGSDRPRRIFRCVKREVLGRKSLTRAVRVPFPAPRLLRPRSFETRRKSDGSAVIHIGDWVPAERARLDRAGAVPSQTSGSCTCRTEALGRGETFFRKSILTAREFSFDRINFFNFISRLATHCSLTSCSANLERKIFLHKKNCNFY